MLAIRRTARPLLVAGAAAAALTLAACGGKPAGGPPHGPAQVGYVVLKAEAVPLTASLPGRTSAYLISDVRPQANGIIKSRLFQEGGDVRAGQVLYQIDAAPYQASLASAQAALAKSQANLATVRLKAQRYKELVAIDAVSKQDYDDANAALQTAVADVAAQKAAVQTAQINLDYARISAPISGRIGKSTVTPGALVTAGQTNALTTITQLDPIYVDVTQSSADLLKLKSEIAAGRLDGSGKAPVKLVLENGQTYAQTGALAFSDVTVDQSTGSVTLRAVFPNPNKVLLPGMYVRAVVDEGVSPNAILAPQTGVSRDPKGDATAFVVGADGKAELRQITVSRTVGPNWLVTSGLKPGDKLIVEGLQMVRPGAPVKAAPATQAGGATPATAPAQQH